MDPTMSHGTESSSTMTAVETSATADPASASTQPDHQASPRLRFDAQGQLIPFTAAERAARAEAVNRMFDELASIPGNSVEEDRAIYRAIDAERPDRPLFEGKY